MILGASGLVGSELLKTLLESDYYGTVISLARKSVPVEHEKFLQLLVDFERLEDFRELIGADDIYCCLGTTMKKAGSKEAFRKVDLDYPVEVAKIGLENGSQRFFIVTAMGADKKSKFYYNQVKGEVEGSVLSLSYKGVQVFRPSLLLGDRKENRFGENIAKAIAPILALVMVGPLKKYKPIEAKDVAKGMLKAALKAETGNAIYDSYEIKQLVRT
jgi:uncharacterized protein YbjT (DUF2867 family)